MENTEKPENVALERSRLTTRAHYVYNILFNLLASEDVLSTVEGNFKKRKRSMP